MWEHGYILVHHYLPFSVRPSPKVLLQHPYITHHKQPAAKTNGYSFLPSPFSSLLRCSTLNVPSPDDHQVGSGSSPPDHLAERPMKDVYYLWSLAGGDLEVELKKHSLIQTKPPISTLPKWASSANTCEVAWWHMFVCIGWWLVKVRHTEPLETEWHFMIAQSYNSPLSNWTRLDLAFILCYSSGHTFLTVETWVPHHWRLLPIIGVNHVSQSDCPAIN